MFALQAYEFDALAADMVKRAKDIKKERHSQAAEEGDDDSKRNE